MRPLGTASHLSVSATGKSPFITAAILPNIPLSLSSRESRILDPENVFGNPVSGLRIFGVLHFSFMPRSWTRLHDGSIRLSY